MAKNKSEKISKRALVVKKNVLNELRPHSMTLQELRFFSIYLSKIDQRDLSTRAVRFPIKDFQRIMDLGVGENLNHFRVVVRHLLEHVVEVPDERGGWTAFQLFKRCRVTCDDFNEWFVEIDAHDDALPLMFEFKDKYLKYELRNALRLRSPNQIRMYELLKQYEKIGQREISVEDLRLMLGLEKKEYPRWDNFKTRVLDSCQQALKDHTDICFTYERGKTGKGGKWLTIVFHIQSNKDYVDQLTLEEFIDQQPEPDEIDLQPEEIVADQSGTTQPSMFDVQQIGVSRKERRRNREKMD